jgi:hypothetical protein
MLKTLKRIKNSLYPMLQNADAWDSLDINYHAPYVERLWLQMRVDDKPVRVNLHCIQPCRAEDALFHPHPWPSAMHIYQGEYEMGMGVGEEVPSPLIAMKMVGHAGTSYSMTHPDAWHYVRPVGTSPVYSLMVTGTPWPKSTVRPNPSQPKEKLDRLSEERRLELLTYFRDFHSDGG